MTGPLRINQTRPPTYCLRGPTGPPTRGADPAIGRRIMKDDFDNGMGIPDEELAGETATPDLGDLPGGVEEIDAEIVTVRPAARAASPRKAKPAKKAAPAAKKPAKKVATKAKPATKAAKKAKPAKKAAKKAAKKSAKKSAKKAAKKAKKAGKKK